VAARRRRDPGAPRGDLRAAGLERRGADVLDELGEDRAPAVVEAHRGVLVARGGVREVATRGGPVAGEQGVGPDEALGVIRRSW
jgi:hypothetical protein